MDKDWYISTDFSPYEEWKECWFAFHLSRQNGLFIAVLWFSLTIDKLDTSA